MKVINESNFDVEAKEGLVLVDFFADWCGPCRALTPTLEQIEKIKIVKVDIDASPELATEYAISSIPCMVFLKDGVEVYRRLGLSPKAVIQAKVDELNA